MGFQARRFAILVVALSALSVTLVACQATSSGTTSTSTLPGGSIVIKTPQLSPTPTFPPFTIGAWPSNYSPQNPDTITIYVLCRAQNASMSGPAQPAAGLTVQVLIDKPINMQASGVTDADGLAAIPVSFSDPNPGIPVIVTVTTSWHGQSYANRTFFTPGATFTPTPTVNPSTTPGKGTPGAGTPTATP